MNIHVCVTFWNSGCTISCGNFLQVGGWEEIKSRHQGGLIKEYKWANRVFGYFMQFKIEKRRKCVQSLSCFASAATHSLQQKLIDQSWFVLLGAVIVYICGISGPPSPLSEIVSIYLTPPPSSAFNSIGLTPYVLDTLVALHFTPVSVSKSVSQSVGRVLD